MPLQKMIVPSNDLSRNDESDRMTMLALVTQEGGHVIKNALDTFAQRYRDPLSYLGRETADSNIEKMANDWRNQSARHA